MIDDGRWGLRGTSDATNKAYREHGAGEHTTLAFSWNAARI